LRRPAPLAAAHAPAPPAHRKRTPRAVTFCGDGANDISALRAALVGLSLCQADASVAAPLTSRVASAAAMARVVAEGRASLAAAYTIFRFIMSYALVQVGV
jgi:cation-transporting ATPase 13A2